MDEKEALREKVIKEKRKTTLENPDFSIVWQAQPSGITGRILSFLHLNFTWYKITNDELMITKGFFNRRTNSIELYLLKDPDMHETLIQRMLKVGTVVVGIDTKNAHSRMDNPIILKDIEKPSEVRKLLRDYIEADVMERGINYFDKV